MHREKLADEKKKKSKDIEKEDEEDEEERKRKLKKVQGAHFSMMLNYQ